MTHISTARGTAALAVLAVVALGTTTACASGTSVRAAPVAPTGSGAPSSLVPVPTPTASVPPGSPTPVPGTAALTAQSYSASGTVLSVYFYAGVCQKYGLFVDQSQPGKVLATVRVTEAAPTGRMCPMVEKITTASTDLGSPLDGRSVVDTATGQPLPQQTPLVGATRTHGPAPSN